MTIPCATCGLADAAPVQPIPWRRYCPACGETTLIVDGEAVAPEPDCDHEWEYDHAQSQGPWTGYIETCLKCAAISQVPM